MLHIDYTATRRFGNGVHCAGGVLVLSSIVAVYAFLYAPTMTATERAHQEITEIQAALRKAPGVHREHADLSEQLREVDQRLGEIRRRVPRQAAESEFISELTALADEVGLVISNLTPSSPKSLGGYSQMEISITGSAGYESVCRFVHGVRQFTRLAKIVGLDVRTGAGGNRGYSVTITVAIYYDLATLSAGEEEA